MLLGYLVDGVVTGALCVVCAVIFSVQMYWGWERTAAHASAAAAAAARASPLLPSRNVARPAAAAAAATATTPGVGAGPAPAPAPLPLTHAPASPAPAPALGPSPAPAPALAAGGGGGGGEGDGSAPYRRQPLIRYYFHRLGLACALARVISSIDLYGTNGLYGTAFRVLWSHSFPVLLFVVALAIWVHETVVGANPSPPLPPALPPLLLL
jgi:hypothetical protein